jgi:DNA-directed RNA polymerase subunit M/transcription elongation factor TFIIS
MSSNSKRKGDTKTMASSITTPKPPAVSTQAPAPISTRPAGASATEPALPIVAHPQLTCPGCGANECSINVYATALRGRNRVRYHVCKRCSRNFKTVSLAKE